MGEGSRSNRIDTNDPRLKCSTPKSRTPRKPQNNDQYNLDAAFVKSNEQRLLSNSMTPMNFYYQNSQNNNHHNLRAGAQSSMSNHVESHVVRKARKKKIKKVTSLQSYGMV